MIGIDKYKHFLVSFILSLIIGIILPLYYTIFIVLLIGISKEIYDYISNKGCAEIGDLVADVLGILFATLILLK